MEPQTQEIQVQKLARDATQAYLDDENGHFVTTRFGVTYFSNDTRKCACSWKRYSRSLTVRAKWQTFATVLYDFHTTPVSRKWFRMASELVFRDRVALYGCKFQ